MELQENNNDKKTGFDTSILNDIIYGRGPHIYAFTTETIPNYLKVGDTNRPVRKRLNEWKRHFPNLEKKFEGSAKIDGENEYFRDYSVHNFLEQVRGKQHLIPEEFDKIKTKPDAHYSPEFFKDGTAEDVSDAIKDINKYYKALKSGSASEYRAYTFYRHNRKHVSDEELCEPIFDYEPRGNQQDVINNFKTAVANGRTNLLMCAVMRFGKTFTSMCCAQEMDAKLVVIVSAKKDVRYEWKNTILTHKKLSHISNPGKGYRFLTKDEDLDEDDGLIERLLAGGERVAVFLTLQYLQGEDTAAKIKQIFGDRKIDLLIVDETHFGARGEKLGTVLYGGHENTTSDNKDKDAPVDRDDDEVVEIEDADKALSVLNRRITLHLSGTPYRILMNDNEFKKEDVIAFIQYTDIVEAQEEWDKDNIENIADVKDKKKAWDNPYYGFPQMIRFAFNLNESSRRMLAQLRESGQSADLSTLLCPKSKKKNSGKSYRKFKHENEVLDLLKVIDGTESDDELMSFLDYDGFKTGQMCRHIVMVLPYKASCDAMANLIKKHRNEFHNLKDYNILNIAGLDCPHNYETVAGVKGAIREYENKGEKTITLTVNRMLTGSTVEEWDTMLYMKGTQSPQEYDQAIFRLQNSYIKDVVETKDADVLTVGGNEEDEPVEIKMNMKPQTLLVDFDPTRMFVMQERRAQIYNLHNGIAGNEQLVAPIERDLEVSPIIAVNAARKLTRIEKASNVMEAVSDYNNDRGIKEEALDVSVDLDLLKNPDILNVIKNEGEIGKKGSLRVNPTADRPEGSQSEVETGDNQGGENEEPSNGDADGTSGGDTKDEQLSLVRKVQNYYARILLFSFITESRVVSLKDIIDSFVNSENTRIKKNLGLDERTVSLIYGYYYENNKTILSELDYKIMDLNALSHSEINPDEKVSIALKKFGKLDDAIVVTPAEICYEMIKLIPEDEFVETIKSGGRILDPVSTAGEFAVAICKRISELSDDVKRDIPDDALKNCFYAIPKSSVCYELTRKTYKMLGLNIDNIATEFDSFDLLDLHKLRVLPVGRRITNKGRYEKKRLDRVNGILTQDKIFSKITLGDEIGEGVRKMNFDIVMGNPPYQQITGGAQAQAVPLYHKFISQAKAMKPKYITMISPSRWFTGGFGLSAFRAEMLNDDRLRIIHDFLDSYDCFPSLGHNQIKGGVSYFLWERDRRGLCKVYSHKDGKLKSMVERPLLEADYDIFIRYNGASSILKKIRERHERSFSEIISAQKPFGLPTNFAEYSATQIDDGIKLYGNKFVGYLPKDFHFDVDPDMLTDMLSKWKLYTPKAVGVGDSSDRVKPLLGEPKSVCTETYVVCGKYDSKEEAGNAVSYINTKFFHFLLTLRKNTQDALATVYKMIPLQNFKEPWTDEKLYAKYNLTDEEIKYIEEMV